MTSLVIVPGWQDSGPAHWQTLWEKNFPGCLRVEQADWLRPQCADWVHGLADAVAQADDTVVLAAHSLGCSAVVHWAASLSLAEQRRVKGALLVAPPDVLCSAFATEVPATGFEREPAWRLPFPSIVVASRDDPYCTIEHARQRAAHWGSHFVDIGLAGHINADSRLGQWEAGQRLLQRLMLGAL
ncbi:RBBP9/YdeN family alpha/beta hydrolase [Paludibacterium purpuratum]|uniref:Alpha/beta hydrolase n=1 Tax=Paludibacterium purpuratum TaxID=1144873 RepID=A0A4R7B6P2_9NEIS|nr:alpha/beta hydrolase [Paludibacterium purpuratum]TDR80341.1 hypothetical protein DFP86_105207 [Paludibacterium purpuratum]